jgi:hypothetical protein
VVEEGNARVVHRAVHREGLDVLAEFQSFVGVGGRSM